jgi:hypothetical protein
MYLSRRGIGDVLFGGRLDAFDDLHDLSKAAAQPPHTVP